MWCQTFSFNYAFLISNDLKEVSRVVKQYYADVDAVDNFNNKPQRVTC